MSVCSVSPSPMPTTSQGNPRQSTPYVFPGDGNSTYEYWKEKMEDLDTRLKEFGADNSILENPREEIPNEEYWKILWEHWRSRCEDSDLSQRGSSTIQRDVEDGKVEDEFWEKIRRVDWRKAYANFGKGQRVLGERHHRPYHEKLVALTYNKVAAKHWEALHCRTMHPKKVDDRTIIGNVYWQTEFELRLEAIQKLQQEQRRRKAQQLESSGQSVATYVKHRRGKANGRSNPPLRMDSSRILKSTKSTAKGSHTLQRKSTRIKELLESKVPALVA